MTDSFRSNCDPFKHQQPVEIPLSPECTEIIDRLERLYGVKVTVPADLFEVVFEHSQYLTIVEGQPAYENAANLAVALFEEEFGLYPLSLVKNTRLTRVVLCGELFRSQKPNPRAVKRNSSPTEWDLRPLHFTHESTGGLPDVVNGLLYLPIEVVEEDPEHIRKIIHHEFYHCVQWQQFGVSSDPEWEATNRSDFVYGPGGIAANYDSDSDFWTKPTEEWGNGFLNLYCMSAPEEDQAELFAHLITEPTRVETRLEVDEILGRKVERMKATLKQFCRDMDDRFWQRVRDSRFPFDL
ncbi:hypothetical protein [uncultured Rubinisphaera sp.]|uniref:hypothetical protein n=1 Tax=uncultured Rubinisphaera sp. TaxID=1678686 RepID=UPI0030DBB6AD